MTGKTCDPTINRVPENSRNKYEFSELTVKKSLDHRNAVFPVKNLYKNGKFKKIEQKYFWPANNCFLIQEIAGQKPFCYLLIYIFIHFLLYFLTFKNYSPARCFILCFVKCWLESVLKEENK